MVQYNEAQRMKAEIINTEHFTLYHKKITDLSNKEKCYCIRGHYPLEVIALHFENVSESCALH